MQPMPLADLADARNNMVDGQLRPNKVTDRRILDAMRRLPREAFVPDPQRVRAYADVEVPIGPGRALLAPVVVARLIQAAGVVEGAAALVLGAGYAAAVLAAIGARVIAVEPESAVRDRARSAYRACGVTVTLIEAPLAPGWPDQGPYDVIFIDGAVSALPPLGAQLRIEPAGRLATVVVHDGRNGVGVMAETAGAALAHRVLFDCTATPLSAFDHSPGFRF